MFKRTLLVAAVVALLGSGCVPSRVSNDKKTEYNPLTVMGQVQAAGKLTIAIPSDRPPFGPGPGVHGLLTTANGGFDVALANEVADALGVKLDIKTAPDAELLSMVQPALVAPSPGAATPSPDPTKVDIAFPLQPITETAVRQKDYAFTDPYFVGHQRLLVPRGSGINEVGDLGGKKVCEALDPETGIDVATLQPSASVTQVSPGQGCVGPLKQKTADAAGASDAVLAGWKLALPGSSIVGDELSTVGYGAVVQGAAGSWKDFVNAQFTEMKTEGRWTTAYSRWLSPALGPPPALPPDMTAEEAAALFPNDIPAPGGG
jgi:ABC-type amino acid transport substrate-binding protein